jgi:hypothetical protein
VLKSAKAVVKDGELKVGEWYSVNVCLVAWCCVCFNWNALKPVFLYREDICCVVLSLYHNSVKKHLFLSTASILKRSVRCKTDKNRQCLQGVSEPYTLHWTSEMVEVPIWTMEWEPRW